MVVSGQRHSPAKLYPPAKDPRYLLDRRLRGPQSWSGHRGYRKKTLPLQGIEPCRPVCSQTLYWLSYTSSYYVCVCVDLFIYLFIYLFVYLFVLKNENFGYQWSKESVFHEPCYWFHLEVPTVWMSSPERERETCYEYQRGGTNCHVLIIRTRVQPRDGTNRNSSNTEYRNTKPEGDILICTATKVIQDQKQTPPGGPRPPRGRGVVRGKCRVCEK
jgi:hypothetical protein